MTREITMIVVHCSATRCNHPYTVHQLYHDHVEVNHWRVPALMPPRYSTCYI